MKFRLSSFLGENKMVFIRRKIEKKIDELNVKKGKKHDHVV